MERLIPFLREVGKSDEADTLEADEKKHEEEIHARWTPQVRKEPKIGRNDPCPCGSGRKFKKCCIEKREMKKEEYSEETKEVDQMRK